MKCPECGKDIAVVCVRPCPAVKRAFKAYERALKAALDAGAEDAHDARLRLRDGAYALACRARRAIKRAEKGSKQ